MIKSTKQKNKTLKSIEKFEKELAKLKKQDIKQAVKEAYTNSYLNMITELKKEVEEYDQLVQGNFELPKNVSFIELLKNLTKLRIAKGLSQSDLAEKLGIDRQQINRYEEHDYQTASLDRIKEIMNVLGIQELINLQPTDDSLSLSPFELNNQLDQIFQEIQQTFCDILQEYTDVKILKAYTGIDIIERVALFALLVKSESLNSANINDFYEDLISKAHPIFEKHKLSNVQIEIDTIVSMAKSDNKAAPDISLAKRNNQVKELLLCSA
jgi:transcriptional regulator with XRE-family HTH domain